MSTNITEIKGLQREIEASRREYMNLFERVPCYITVQDRDYRIIESNEAFKKEFGIKLGERCYRAYKNRDELCPDCPVEKTFADGRVHCREERVVREDGHEAHMLVYSSPIFNESNEQVAVMEMSTDITEIKRLQRELANMGRTVALMAHRVKNILMGLEGGIFVVNTGMEKNDGEMTSRGWAMIERNVELISRIVKDLLYCSKEREMKKEAVDPRLTVLSVHELFRDVMGKDGIELKLEIADDLPDGYFDPEALHSLLTNLVTNAFDACRGDAREDVDCHCVTLRAHYDDRKRHVFEVEDNGPGIPGPVGERLFEDFFSTKGREGTGLGLLVANRIVEEHGGVITFISQENQGTAFRAVFPDSLVAKSASAADVGQPSES